MLRQGFLVPMREARTTQAPNRAGLADFRAVGGSDGGFRALCPESADEPEIGLSSAKYGIIAEQPPPVGIGSPLRGTCLMPVGYPDPGWRYCGKPAVRFGSWCAECRRVVFVRKAEPAEREAA